MNAPTHASAPPRAAAVGFDPGFLGVPVPLPGVGGRSVVELAYTHFTVVVDTVRALAACAAVNIDGTCLVDVPGPDLWRTDPRLPRTQQTGQGVYERNAIDRTPLVRRRDPCWGPRAVAQQAGTDTSHDVNAAPQVASFSRSKDLWAGLETRALDAAPVVGGRLSVLSGPVLADDDPTYRGVGIPRRFYKVIAWADARRGGALTATGYVLDQSAPLVRIGIADPTSLRVGDQGGRAAGPGLGVHRTYQVPVSSIEEITGLDLAALAAADRAPADAAGAGADGLDPPGWVELDAAEAITV